MKKLNVKKIILMGIAGGTVLATQGHAAPNDANSPRPSQDAQKVAGGCSGKQGCHNTASREVPNSNTNLDNSCRSHDGCTGSQPPAQDNSCKNHNKYSNSCAGSPKNNSNPVADACKSSHQPQNNSYYYQQPQSYQQQQQQNNNSYYNQQQQNYQQQQQQHYQQQGQQQQLQANNGVYTQWETSDSGQHYQHYQAQPGQQQPQQQQANSCAGAPKQQGYTADNTRPATPAAPPSVPNGGTGSYPINHPMNTKEVK